MESKKKTITNEEEVTQCKDQQLEQLNNFKERTQDSRNKILFLR